MVFLGVLDMYIWLYQLNYCHMSIPIFYTNTYHNPNLIEFVLSSLNAEINIYHLELTYINIALNNIFIPPLLFYCVLLLEETMSVMFGKLQLLKGTGIVCRIRVRITRMWPSIANNGNFMYTNMILLDSEVRIKILHITDYWYDISYIIVLPISDWPTIYPLFLQLLSQDYHVHAFVYSDDWNAFRNLLFEGNVYDFTNFITREATGSLRPVSTGISIVFTSHTRAQPVPLEVTTIPRHKFEITPIGDLYDLAMSYVADDSPVYAIGDIFYIYSFHSSFYKSSLHVSHSYDL